MIIIKKIFRFYIFSALFVCLLFSSNVFAGDFAINDVLLPDAIEQGYDFNIDVVVTNNSSAQEDIDVDINIYSPQGSLLNDKTETISDVNSYGTKQQTITYNWVDVDAVGTVNSHVIALEISNDPGGASSENNLLRKYFIISKPDRKSPVPDFPIVFSILLLFSIVYIFSKQKKKPTKS